MKIWKCKIGEIEKLPPEVTEVDARHSPPRAIHMSCDQWMRRAIENAYEELIGDKPTFVFSGWAGELTPGERAVVDDVTPMAEACTWYQARCTVCLDPPDYLDGAEWRATPEEAVTAAVDEAEWLRVDEHTLLCTDCREEHEHAGD